MKLEIQILIALALDVVIGDPRWLPHPVRFLGWLAQLLEAPTRSLMPLRIAGIMTALLVICVAVAGSAGLIVLAGIIHPWAADLVAIAILYYSFAAGDLALHAKNVMAQLASGRLSGAREKAALMVGRDTETLDEPGIVRATVESVAENTVDGVTGSLFFACLLGPVGAMAYKAIGTLDSTFGYKNERYREFGWASARLDDAANWLPARVTGLIIPVAAGLAGQQAADSLRVMLRDGAKHSSPNAGIAEAAVAGALGVQLGGSSVYQGNYTRKPTLGDPVVPLVAGHIEKTVQLMWNTTFLATVVFVVLGWILRNTVAGIGG